MCSVNVAQAQGKDWIKFFTAKDSVLNKPDSIQVSVKDAIVKNSTLIRYDIVKGGVDSVFFINIGYLNDSIFKNKFISLKNDTIKFKTANINLVAPGTGTDLKDYMLKSNVYMSWIILGVLSALLLVFGITQYYLRKKVPTTEKEQYPKYEDPKWVLNNLLRDNLGLLAHIKKEYKLEEIKSGTFGNTGNTSADFNVRQVINKLTEQEKINILKDLLAQPELLRFIMTEYGLQKTGIDTKPTPVITHTESVVLTTKYAGHPAHKSNEFVQPSDKIIPGMTIYELAIDEKNGKGTFKIIDNEPSHFLAIREYDTRILPACDYTGEPKNSTKILTTKAGTIKKSSGGWEIVTKAKIEFK